MTAKESTLLRILSLFSTLFGAFVATTSVICPAEEVVWGVLDNPCANLDPSNGSAAIHRLMEGAVEHLNGEMKDGDTLVLEFPSGIPIRFKGQGILLDGEPKRFERGDSPFLAPEVKGDRRLIIRGSEKGLGKLATVVFRHSDDTGFDFRWVNNITIEYLHFTSEKRYKYEGDVVRVDGQRVYFRPTPGFTSVEEVEAKATRQRTLRRILGDPMDPEPDTTLGKYVLDGRGAMPTDQPGVYVVIVTKGDASVLRPKDHLAFKNKITGDVIRLERVRDVTIQNCRFTRSGGRIIKSRESDGLVIRHNQLDRGEAVDTDGDGVGDRKSFYASNGGAMMIGYTGEKAPLIEYNRILCCADDVLGLTDSGYEQTGRPTPGLVVRGNVFRGAHGDCVILRPAAGALIEKNQFIQVRQAAVRTNAKSTITRDIVIRDNVLIGQGGTFGFVGLAEAPDTNIQITGNTIIGLPNTALQLGYNRDILFANNVIRSFSYPPEKLGLIGIGNWSRTEGFQLDGTGRGNQVFGDCSKLREYVVPGRDFALPTGAYDGPEVDDLSIEFVRVNGNLEFGFAKSEGLVTTVDLINTYERPVLVVTPVSEETEDVLTANIVDVGPISFTVRTRPHTRLNYMCLEAGTYTLPNGLPIEAHQIPLDAASLKNQYTSPVVLHSANGMVAVESFCGAVGGVQLMAKNFRFSGSKSFDLEGFLFTPRGALVGRLGAITGEYPVRTKSIRLESTSQGVVDVPVLIFQVNAALELDQRT
jgi:hypothetical protein